MTSTKLTELSECIWIKFNRVNEWHCCAVCSKWNALAILVLRTGKLFRAKQTVYDLWNSFLSQFYGLFTSWHLVRVHWALSALHTIVHNWKYSILKSSAGSDGKIIQSPISISELNCIARSQSKIRSNCLESNNSRATTRCSEQSELYWMSYENGHIGHRRPHQRFHFRIFLFCDAEQEIGSSRNVRPIFFRSFSAWLCVVRFFCGWKFMFNAKCHIWCIESILKRDLT